MAVPFKYGSTEDFCFFVCVISFQGEDPKLGYI